jgi:thiamine biosynthesis lipoprotein
MKQTKIIMGMPITIEIVNKTSQAELNKIFNYFKSVDNRYSTYKTTSEIAKINHGLAKSKWSSEMKTVMKLCEQTKTLTNGYFDIAHSGQLDPSGLVKGWSINNASKMLISMGKTDFYIEAGGDIQVQGKDKSDKVWEVGIRNPFEIKEIIKVIKLKNQGVATSGTYIRGQHIYNPFSNLPINEVKSLTVIGPNVYEADRFATAAFAMGVQGIAFIEAAPGFEGYMVDNNKIATFTSGFRKYEA